MAQVLGRRLYERLAGVRVTVSRLPILRASLSSPQLHSFYLIRMRSRNGFLTRLQSMPGARRRASGDGRSPLVSFPITGSLVVVVSSVSELQAVVARELIDGSSRCGFQLLFREVYDVRTAGL